MHKTGPKNFPPVPLSYIFTCAQRRVHKETRVPSCHRAFFIEMKLMECSFQTRQSSRVKINLLHRHLRLLLLPRRVRETEKQKEADLQARLLSNHPHYALKLF